MTGCEIKNGPAVGIVQPYPLGLGDDGWGERNPSVHEVLVDIFPELCLFAVNQLATHFGNVFERFEGSAEEANEEGLCERRIWCVARVMREENLCRDFNEQENNLSLSFV